MAIKPASLRMEPTQASSAGHSSRHAKTNFPARLVLLCVTVLSLCSACVSTSARPPVVISKGALEAFNKEINSGVPILQALYSSLQAKYPKWDGSAYAFRPDNALPPSAWIVDTPYVWGQDAAEVKNGAGDFVVRDISELVSNAEQFVDITSLYPFPTGQFHEGIVQGLINVLRRGRSVQVRILVGLKPDPEAPRAIEYLQKLVQDISAGFPSGFPNASQLDLYVAYQRTDILTWNHAKMVAVDGRQVLLGGENQWDSVYLETAPVHDLNIRLDGPIVYHMHRFTDTTWGEVCNYFLPSWKPLHWNSKSGKFDKECLSRSPVQPTAGGQGDIAVLGAGRYGRLNHVNPADDAMVMAMLASKQSIRIAQQDLLNVEVDPWISGFDAIARALAAERDVYIVLTNDNAKAGVEGASYSTSTIRLTAEAIKVATELVMKDPDRVNELLCNHLHLTTLRFGPSDKWPNGFEFAHHSKFMMFDDALFYVGSENLYPADLIEYGVFLSDPGAIRQMRSAYWDQLWNYSKTVAISGAGVERCYFRK